jgi:tetratricopeptide (TPR) repeat protein
MMFFKKMFNKDYRFYLEKGEKYFAEERFSDARHAFQEALQKVIDQPEGSGSAETEIRNLLLDAGNRLAQMNAAEAEHAMNRGDYAKAEEHLELVIELASDAAIREKAESLRAGLKHGASAVELKEAHHDCSGCTTSATTASENDHVPEFLSAQERFDLLVQTLPGGLRERYSALGEKFATGYLLVHGGEVAAGARILQDLLNSGENDILLYEIALTYFNAGDLIECERLLRKALDLNNDNPLCCLGLVQLLTDTGRLAESLPVLNHMIDKQLLTEQSLLFLGDVHQGLGNDDEAMTNYTKALTYPNASRAAAERLIPLFESHGRREDAAYLFKRYLKGCC